MNARLALRGLQTELGNLLVCLVKRVDGNAVLQIALHHGRELGHVDIRSLRLEPGHRDAGKLAGKAAVDVHDAVFGDDEVGVLREGVESEACGSENEDEGKRPR